MKRILSVLEFEKDKIYGKFGSTPVMRAGSEVILLPDIIFKFNTIIKWKDMPSLQTNNISITIIKSYGYIDRSNATTIEEFTYTKNVYYELTDAEIMVFLLNEDWVGIGG